jgi:hypothetical protein
MTQSLPAQATSNVSTVATNTSITITSHSDVGLFHFATYASASQVRALLNQSAMPAENATFNNTTNTILINVTDNNSSGHETNNSSTSALVTFPPNHQNQAAIVAHCGDCGTCSNPYDINIYDVTQNTLFSTTVDCSKRALLWGRKTATNCMMDNVGFT